MNVQRHLHSSFRNTGVVTTYQGWPLHLCDQSNIWKRKLWFNEDEVPDNKATSTFWVQASSAVKPLLMLVAWCCASVLLFLGSGSGNGSGKLATKTPYWVVKPHQCGWLCVTVADAFKSTCVTLAFNLISLLHTHQMWTGRDWEWFFFVGHRKGFVTRRSYRAKRKFTRDYSLIFRMTSLLLSKDIDMTPAGYLFLNFRGCYHRCFPNKEPWPISS